VEYVDFDLQIEPKSGGRYRARVLDSPGGQASHEFSLPFSDLELENFLLRIGHARRRMRRLESTETHTAKLFGGQLFETVFSGAIRSALSASLAEVRRRNVGLRLRLRLTDAPELCNLPWEFLYDGALNRFLCLSKETPVVRFLELPDASRPLTVKPPLHVLVMIASPTDYPPLDVEREWSQLSGALADVQSAGLVTVDRLKIASLLQLQRRLKDREYHIFHFIGHAGFDDVAQDGALVLEDENRRGRVVSGQDLGMLLADHRSLRLIVLNACEGARAGRVDPFAGAAQSLLQQGIPAVIAMQFEISDSAAIAFSHEFYDTLARRYPVDAALAEARRAVFAGENELEWGTPVLYMRCEDGRVFEVEASETSPQVRQAPTPPAPARPDPEAAARRERTYTQALAAFYSDQWEEACTLLRQIVAEEPGYREAAARLAQAEKEGRLAELYRAGASALADHNWSEASRSLSELVGLAPQYRDAAALAEEARRKATLADLQQEARMLATAGRWRPILKVFDRIQTIDSSYGDPEGLLAAARQQVEIEEHDLKVAQLYAEGVRLLDEAQWAKAVTRLQEVQRLQPGYQATGGLLERGQRALAEQQVSQLWVSSLAAIEAGRWDEACRSLRSLLAVQPDANHPARGRASDLLAAALRRKEVASMPPPPRGRPKPDEPPK